MYNDASIKKLEDKVVGCITALITSETKEKIEALNNALNAYHRALEEFEEKTKKVIGKNRSN